MNIPPGVLVDVASADPVMSAVAAMKVEVEKLSEAGSAMIPLVALLLNGKAVDVLRASADIIEQHAGRDGASEEDAILARLLRNMVKTANTALAATQLSLSNRAVLGQVNPGLLH